jgi:serine/threonine protein kinase
VLLLGNFEDILSGKKLKRVETEGRESERTYYTMDDLEKRGLLGQGAFGKVNLVRSKKDNRLFALKAQGKAFIVENEQQNHTIAEYKLLREINHPLIVKMYRELCRVCTPFILFLPFPNSFNHFLHRGVAG